jgi:hypothetical protein
MAAGRHKWYSVSWIGLVIAAILHGLNDRSRVNGHPLWILVVLVSGILFLGYAKVGSRGDLEVPEGWPSALRLRGTPARARSRSARRTARRNVGPAPARDCGRSARAGRSVRRPAGQTVVGALTADPAPLLTVHLLGMEDQAAAYRGHRCHNGRVSDRRG